MIRIRNVFRFALLGLVLPIILGVGQAGTAVAATPTDLFISEYIEGSSNNKAIEIYNGTGADIDLTAGAYNIQQFSNGSASAGLTINLTGTIAAGDVYVIAHSSADAAILAQADLTTGAGLFNGDDALALRKGVDYIDVFGQIGFDPGTEWGTGLTSTADNTLRRKADICAGDPDGSDPFDPALEWDGYATNTFDGLGSHTANCGGPEELFISEYIEGSSNNKAIEIFNGTGADVDLAAGGYNLQQFSNGSATAGLTINLTGTLADGDVFVIAHSSADAAILAQADLTTGAGLFNGDDALALRKGVDYIDVFGQIGFDPGTEWGTGLTSTADNTLRRKAAVCAGDPDGSDPFDPAIEWDGYATNTFDGLGSHSVNCAGGGGGDTAPSVTETTPADNAVNVPANTNITITFNEAVTISGTVAVTGTSSGNQNLTPATADNLTFTLDPADFATGETVTVTVAAVQVSDQDTQDPPDNLAADYIFSFSIFTPSCGEPATLISAVQGSGSASPLVGSAVTIEGIVVGDFQDETPEPPNELNGFFLQEEDADSDGNPATSEGVFVFDGANPATADVLVGDKVRVTGTVIEFNGLTEIGGPLTVEVCSSGNPLPTPATITLPVTALSDLEKYEGMYVQFPQELTVTEIFTLGRFGEVLLSQGGRLPNPTHIAEPGAAAQAVRDANILRSILLDDGLTNQNPDPIIHPSPGLTASNTLRGGDTVTGLAGTLYYGFTNEYRLMPTGPIDWVHENARPATPPDVGGSLQVASYNVLNYFTSLGSRGAESVDEFVRQHDKIINALLALDADIVGLIELENHPAANPPGDGVDPVLESIVDALNAELGSEVYSFIDTGVIGTDEIKTAFIYKTATVTPVGAFAILDSSVDPNFIDTRNRPVLAQTFMENATGEQLTVAVNHLKSKGSDCGGAPDDQPDTAGGNCNGTRTAAALALANWLASDPTGSGDPDYLVIGDLNSYAKEDPIDALVAAGYTDLLATPDGSKYSYVFDGEWGYLDYALSNASLTAQVSGAAPWHTNADEPIVLDYNTNFKTEAQQSYLYDDSPFRASDHDPVLIGLNLESNNAPDCSGAYPSLASIWPPNNKFKNVNILGVTDPDGDPFTTTILSIFQDESVNGPADGQGVGTSTAKVRAERNGNGNGRFYHITYQATDSNGGECVGTVKVVVPHDKSGKTPVDGGPLYDSAISQ